MRLNHKKILRNVLIIFGTILIIKYCKIMGAYNNKLLKIDKAFNEFCQSTGTAYNKENYKMFCVEHLEGGK